MILTKQVDGLKRVTSQYLRNKSKNGMEWTRKQNLGRAPLQHILEWSCWITNNENNKLDMVLWNTCQIMRWQTATHGKRIGLVWPMRRENYFTGRIDEELGSYIITINRKILRERFRWNITQDNSNEEIDGFKIPHSWQHVNHEAWREIVKNDITPPQKIRERIALRNARWRILELLKTRHVLNTMLIFWV